MPPPLTVIISPNTSDQNFDIAILLNIVESTENCVFKDDIPPQP